MTTDQKNPGELETWAIVEVMGHSRYAGFVRQVAMGGAAMIRVDVPALPEIPAREESVRDYDYEAQKYVMRNRPVAAIPAMPGYTKFLGVSAIFAITPCTEEVARAAVERFRAPPMTILDVTGVRALPAPEDDDGDDRSEE